MNFRQVILLTTAFIIFNFALSNKAYSDSVDAAIDILGAKHDIEANYKLCRDRAGVYGYKYDYIKYIWELKYRPYLQLSDNLFENLPVSKATEVKKLWENSHNKILSNKESMDTNVIGKHCSQYFSQLMGGTVHELNSQKQNLTPKLGSVEDVRIIERNIDMEVACMKQGFNSDIKRFDDIKQVCSCQTALVVKTMSNQDIDKYLDLASSQNQQAAVQFISQRINISELRACYGQSMSR